GDGGAAVPRASRDGGDRVQDREDQQGDGGDHAAEGRAPGDSVHKRQGGEQQAQDEAAGVPHEDPGGREGEEQEGGQAARQGEGRDRGDSVHKRQGGQQQAQEEAAGVPHEDPGGWEVEDQEGDQAAQQGEGQDRRGRRVLEDGDDAHGRRREGPDPGGQAVHA